jgi:SnoaL-like domain
MDRDAYDRYLRMFNARDYDGVLSHFADHFDLVFAGYRFTTKAEVRDFYAFLHTYVNESVDVQHFMSTQDMIVLEAEIRLEGLADLTPDLLARRGLSRIHPLTKGQVVRIPQFIHYHLKDGKIVKALCAIYEPPRPG